ncbi:MAG: hypothetical protein A3A97_04755 [Candidatus Terrybacteria bacterium RIFCSPLOWO2_01_FULL_40_23]|uniref:Uncharacterized protein n=1 Tax=Candidatus Terrybacteria bacterium RIFCSPLOWO2_01_FULL_40_23 TaxID=1802366 RepID=A0A1G2PV36_9BACT|nr:MAG: hypothetical protein A3A97_04755 [Candidatus Terrybacteria bacterium RIFCSPLOWO2_01_FULL_40_23]
MKAPITFVKQLAFLISNRPSYANSDKRIKIASHKVKQFTKILLLLFYFSTIGGSAFNKVASDSRISGG